jgi:hypothetical protein
LEGFGFYCTWYTPITWTAGQDIKWYIVWTAPASMKAAKYRCWLSFKVISLEKGGQAVVSRICGAGCECAAGKSFCVHKCGLCLIYL